MKHRVLKSLKPKAASLGFNEKELEGVATQIAGTLQEDASDEQIDTQIEAVLPYLKVSQSAATRIVNAEKEKLNKEKPEKDEPNEKGSRKSEKDDDEPAWFRKYREENDAKVAAILEEKTRDSRRKVFEESLKDIPEKLKEAELRAFDRLSFKDDDDFESYKSERETLMGEIIQENANSNLEKHRRPVGGGGKGEEKPTEEEIKKVFGK